jgi:hypothetical protein
MPDCGCPDIETEEWDYTEHDWAGKTFYTVPTTMLFHIPVGMSKSITRMTDEIQAKGYRLAQPARVLCRDAMFRGHVMIEVEPPGGTDPRVWRFPAGRLVSVVHPGPWKRVGAAAVDLKKHTGKKPRALYFWYVACPECRKERGERTVVFAYYG